MDDGMAVFGYRFPCTRYCILYTISFSCCLFPRYAKIFMEELPKIPELRDQENYLWRIKDAAESPLFWRFFSLVFFSMGTIVLYEIWTGVR